jgi:hypothetical protein
VLVWPIQCSGNDALGLSSKSPKRKDSASIFLFLECLPLRYDSLDPSIKINSPGTTMEELQVTQRGYIENQDMIAGFPAGRYYLLLTI